MAAKSFFHRSVNLLSYFDSFQKKLNVFRKWLNETSSLHSHTIFMCRKDSIFFVSRAIIWHDTIDSPSSFIVLFCMWLFMWSGFIRKTRFEQVWYWREHIGFISTILDDLSRKTDSRCKVNNKEKFLSIYRHACIFPKDWQFFCSTDSSEIIVSSRT